MILKLNLRSMVKLQMQNGSSSEQYMNNSITGIGVERRSCKVQSYKGKNCKINYAVNFLVNVRNDQLQTEQVIYRDILFLYYYIIEPQIF